jgi:hypothetical protein
MEEPTVLGVADTLGISMLHPKRAGRSTKQVGRFGISNRVWLVGGKLGVVLNKWGLVCAWDCATANVYDTHFHPLIERFREEMVVLADHGFYSAKGSEGYGKRRRKEWAEPNSSNPQNMKICRRGEWNDRMVVETFFSMLTTVFHLKKVGHRVWNYFQTRLGFAMALFNLLAQWSGLSFDQHGRVHLSVAQFSF